MRRLASLGDHLRRYFPQRLAMQYPTQIRSTLNLTNDLVMLHLGMQFQKSVPCLHPKTSQPIRAIIQQLPMHPPCDLPIEHLLCTKS